VNEGEDIMRAGTPFFVCWSCEHAKFSA